MQLHEEGRALKARIDRLARMAGGRARLAAAAVALALLLGCAGVLGARLAAGGLDDTNGVVLERGSATASEAGATEGAGSSSAPSGDGAAGGADAGAEQATPSTIVVDVSGAVAAPAVVRLAAGSRVGDAIEAAGGVAPEADLSAINRAALLSDGQKVIVPKVGEVVEAAGAEATGSSASTGSQGASANGASGDGASTSLININSATAEELDQLPGVGPSTAQAIIEDRAQNGPFASVEDLMRVSGIGEKKFAKLKGSICV